MGHGAVVRLDDVKENGMTVIGAWEDKREKMLKGNGSRTIDGKTYIMLDRPSVTVPYAHGFGVDDKPDTEGNIDIVTIMWDADRPADDLDWRSPRIIGSGAYHILSA